MEKNRRLALDDEKKAATRLECARLASGLVGAGSGNVNDALRIAQALYAFVSGEGDSDAVR